MIDPRPVASMALFWLLGCSLVAVGCSDRARPGAGDSAVLDSALPDGMAGDGAPPDGGLPDGGLPDSGIPDSGIPDGALPDSGIPDGALPDGALPDGGIDAAMDASDDAAMDASDDAAMDASDDAAVRTPILFESATPGVPTSSGVAISETFYSGWRFEVPAGTTVTTDSVGSIAAGTGTIFGVMVRLTGPSDVPDAADLSGGDVLGSTVLPMPGAATPDEVRGALRLTLTPGWYAVVFGTGKFGAAGSSGNARQGQVPVPGVQGPFSLRQSDGMFIPQSAGVRFFVEGTSE